MASFLCPDTCGFGRILALEASRKVSAELSRENGENPTRFKSRVQQESFALFKTNFSDVGENFNLDLLKFSKKLPTLRQYINKWNHRKLDEKAKYIETFSGTLFI